MPDPAGEDPATNSAPAPAIDRISRPRAVLLPRPRRWQRSYRRGLAVQEFALPYSNLEKKRAWGLRNPGRQSAEASRASCSKWRKANPGAMNALKAKRRARKLKQTCTCCSREKFQAIYDVAKMFGDEVDHIKPLALGGLHCRHNLQLLSPAQHRLKTVADLAAIKLHKSLEIGNAK